MLNALRDRLNQDVLPALDLLQVPGVAIGVRVDDHCLTLGYGITNLEHPLPVDGETIFQIGSISKTFVGVIAAQLEEEGTLDIDEPVAGLLMDLGTLDPRVTMRHLLTHSAGIDAQHMIGGARALLANHADDSIQASIQHFCAEELMFDPGSEFSYSGPGFMVAAAVIERLTGRVWKDVLQERVLDPAGMAKTFTTADEVITHRVAAPHGVNEGKVILKRDEGWQLHWQLPGWDVPGGGVLSTAKELMLYGAYTWRTGVDESYFRHLMNRGLPGQDIAYAWKRERRRGRVALGHDGLTIGYASRFMSFPEERVTYAILTNSLKGGPLNNRIEQIILDELFGHEDQRSVITRDAPHIADLEGVYDCGFYGHVELKRRDDGVSFELTPITSPVALSEGDYVIEPLAISRLVPDGESILSSDPGAESPDSIIGYLQDVSGAVTALRIGERIARKVTEMG